MKLTCCEVDDEIYSSKKETQNHIKKRNAKPHSKKETQNHIIIGDIGKIILIAVW